MNAATQKQIDYIKLLIAGIENAPYVTKIEKQMTELQSNEDWQSQSKLKNYENHLRDWHAHTLGIDVYDSPLTSAELKSKIAQAANELRQRIAGDLTTVEASKIIDMLKNNKLV